MISIHPAAAFRGPQGIKTLKDLFLDKLADIYDA